MQMRLLSKLNFDIFSINFYFIIVEVNEEKGSSDIEKRQLSSELWILEFYIIYFLDKSWEFLFLLIN